MIVNEQVGDVTSPTVGIIGHGVNCQGVMGSGVALTIRNKFPKAYEEYLAYCADRAPETLLGDVQLVQITENLYVANMFTQLSYGGDGKIYASQTAIRAACATLASKREELIIRQHAWLINHVRNYLSDMVNDQGMDLGTSLRGIAGSPRFEHSIDCVTEAVLALNDAYEDDELMRYNLPIHLPLIGCGLGGLDWNDVRHSIHTHTRNAPVTIYHYK